jgi:hypothetical protein
MSRLSRNLSRRGESLASGNFLRDFVLKRVLASGNFLRGFFSRLKE